MNRDAIKKGLPVWIQLHKNQAKIAGTIIDYTSHKGTCMVELALPNPFQEDQVIYQVYPRPIQSHQLSRRTPARENAYPFTETGVSCNVTPQEHTIYTLGYGIEARAPQAARAQVEMFLKQPTPGVVIDVRLTPYSKLPGWNTEDLQRSYQARYMHIRELGNLHHHRGLPIKLVDEENGLQQLQCWLEQFNILLLCGCYKVETCHRGYIADHLAARTQVPICHLPVPGATRHTPPTQTKAPPQPSTKAARPKTAENKQQRIILWTPELWETRPESEGTP